jgi:hypothetical protein
MKRLVTILFTVVVGALTYSDHLWPQSPVEASAQGRARGGASKWGKFTHASHEGEVKVLGTTQTRKLDCAYCHDVTKEKQAVNAYPNTRPGNNETHSSCTECHNFTGRDAVVSGVFPAMCVVCHSSNTTAVAQMKRNLRAFPNASVELSQFGDEFSHKTHKDYLDKFNCSECHTANAQPVTILGKKFDKGVKMSAPEHLQCFTCHFDEKTITKKNPTYALNCVGCHSDLTPAKGKPPEPAVSFFARKVVEPDKPVDGKKIVEPFSHDHHKGTGTNNSIKGKVSAETKECLSCHLTGMTADKRSDFFTDPKTKAPQPPINGCKDCAPVNGCLNCHQRYTNQKIEGAVRLETSKCLYCHSVGMMKGKAASGLPPASHFGQALPATAPAVAAATTPATTPPRPEPKPAPTPVKTEPKPEVKAEVKPAPKPEPPKAEVKPAPPAPPVRVEPKPEPKPAPPAPAPKAEPPKAETKTAVATPPPAPKPEPKPEPKVETPKPATPAPAAPKPEPKPEPPKAEPPKAEPPKPVPATPAPAAPAPPAGARQTLPGKMKLGDPKENPYWGLDAKWGLVEFDHTTHIKPSYAASCQTCHHTNKDAQNELVPKCVSCHQTADSPKTPKNKAGDPIDVKLAYHGNPDNTTNDAGCITCHQKAKENGKENAITKCGECHEQKNAFLSPDLFRNWNRASDLTAFNSSGASEGKILMTSGLQMWYPHSQQKSPGEQPTSVARSDAGATAEKTSGTDESFLWSLRFWLSLCRLI